MVRERGVADGRGGKHVEKPRGGKGRRSEEVEAGARRWENQDPTFIQARGRPVAAPKPHRRRSVQGALTLFSNNAASQAA